MWPAPGQQPVGGGGLVQPRPQPGLTAHLPGVGGQGSEEPVHADGVHEPLGLFQGKLPVGADRGQPTSLVAVFGAEQGGADRAEQVVPGSGAGLAVRPEPAQHSDLHEHGQPVPRCRCSTHRQ